MLVILEFEDALNLDQINNNMQNTTVYAITFILIDNTINDPKYTFLIAIDCIDSYNDESNN